MLVEFQHVTQNSRTGRRRWFQGASMDLIVWLDAAGGTEGFQLCYQGEGRKEHALTWRAPAGFSHARVDTGDTRPDKNLTPILVADGEVPWARLQAEFAADSAELEPALREFVRARLAEGGR